MADPGGGLDRSSAALRCERVGKSYAGTQVLQSFECTIANGEVHALLGENGSGKSTFIKILAGVVSPDAGSPMVAIGGGELTFGSPEASFALGCRFVHQDLGLIEELTVMDNVLMVAGYPTRLGGIKLRTARETVQADLARVGIDANPHALVRDLSPATKTGIAVARALRPVGSAPPRLMVLDEPTATMPDDEVDRLLDVIRNAQANGIGILYVTHRLDEIFDIAQTVTVLRDGHRITTQPVRTLDKRGLIRLVAGSELTEELGESAAREIHMGRRALTVRGMSGGSVDHASFSVNSGEIVGIAGITGSGRESMLPLLFGAIRRRGGAVSVGVAGDGDGEGEGKAVPANRPDKAVASGMGYLPPDRKVAGGFVDLTALENTTIGNLRPYRSRFGLNRRTERADTTQWLHRLHVRPDGAIDSPLSSFSGGNQQKILFAKWLRLALDVFLLDEPTQGVDVHAKALLHRQLVASTQEGLAALVSSTDLDELVGLCDRVLVFRDGTIVAELSGDTLTAPAISHACLSGAEVTI